MVYTLKQTPSVPHREATPGSSSYGPVVQQLWSCLGGYRCWANSSHNVTRATKAQTCLGVTHRATSPFHSQLAGEQELALSPQGNRQQHSTARSIQKLNSLFSIPSLLCTAPLDFLCYRMGCPSFYFLIISLFLHIQPIT